MTKDKNNQKELEGFLLNKMSMSHIYQPLIIRELLAHNGTRRFEQIAKELAATDESFIDYYINRVKKYPKEVLQSHGIVTYNSKTKEITLSNDILGSASCDDLISICDKKIKDWVENSLLTTKEAYKPSVRYQVIKNANGKCQACGISKDISPMDVDHIVPQSKADKNGMVKKDGH